MDVTIKQQDGVLSVRVGGRIDGSNAYEFEKTIKTAIADNDRAVLMDFEKLSYISPALVGEPSTDPRGSISNGPRSGLCTFSVRGWR